MGLNKPYNTMTWLSNVNPNFYHIDLGTRYTINPYIGIKGILAMINSQIKVTQKNLTATTYE
jgi:hypothetical protein